MTGKNRSTLHKLDGHYPIYEEAVDKTLKHHDVWKYKLEANKQPDSLPLQRDLTICAGFLATGLRRGELARLRLRHYDFRSHYITMDDEEREKGSHRTHVYLPSKGRFALPAMILRQWIETKVPRDSQYETLVFPSFDYTVPKWGNHCHCTHDRQHCQGCTKEENHISGRRCYGILQAATRGELFPHELRAIILTDGSIETGDPVGSARLWGINLQNLLKSYWRREIQLEKVWENAKPP